MRRQPPAPSTCQIRQLFRIGQSAHPTLSGARLVDASFGLILPSGGIDLWILRDSNYRFALRAPTMVQPRDWPLSLTGTLRRECLDLLIPLGERHLRQVVREFGNYYNGARVHMSLGPGVPASTRVLPSPGEHRHSIRAGHRGRSSPVPWGLHHEYFLEQVAP
jgi:hypothetical protein